ncbi:replication initiator protein A [Deinococcus gobiensis]|nr:replication initiator protein A [Deinococcus gobiensis]
MAQENVVTRYGIDERNLARINPILALNRLPDDMTGWQKTIQVDDQGVIELTCEAGKRLAPHGIDADVVFALTTAYYLQGRPDDYTVTLNVSQLCDLAGLTRGKDKYARIQESIQRLKVVQFTSRNSWGRPSKRGWQWASLSFGVIDSIREADEVDELEQAGRYTAKTTLRIRLNEDLVNSIRDDHTRLIDMTFYVKLKQPLTRLLYRLLEEQRHLSSQPACYQISLIAWGDHLGFREVDTSKSEIAPGVPATRVIRSDRIQRALEPAHQELIDQNYLNAVVKTHRGKNQTLHYIFKHPAQITESEAPINQEIVDLLTARYVTPGRAENFSRVTALGDVQRAVEIYEGIVKYKTVKNKGGLMADILTHPAKYESKIVTATEPSAVQSPTPVLEETEVVSKPTEEQRGMLSRMLKKTVLPEATIARLIDAVMTSQLPLSEVVTLSVYKDTALAAHVAALLARLPTPDGDH